MFYITPHKPRPLTWWLSRKDRIDFSPPYQRSGGIWSSSDKAFLIDSILNGFDIPKFYLADFQYGESPLNQKKLPYAIIDGKQRFEAIFDFFEGKIQLNDDFSFRTHPNLKIGGYSFAKLKENFPDIAEIFENFIPDIVGVYTSDESLIQELFVRLNRSKPLVGAEIRNAFMGPITEMVREITRHSFFLENIKFRTDRGQDKNTATKLLMLEYNFPEYRDTKKVDLDQFVATADHTRALVSVAQVLTQLSYMAATFLPDDKLLSASGIIPVYYLFFRHLHPDNLRYVRPFLVNFEHDRKAAMRDQLLELHPFDHEDFIEFNRLNRNTNDAVSHRRRVSILNDAFIRSLADRLS